MNFKCNINRGFLPNFDNFNGLVSWFSHDVDKIQTTKLSILLTFYFRDVLEQLKTNIHTIFLL